MTRRAELAGWRFWALCVLTFASLIYSSGLHFAYGPEHTILNRWHFESPASESTVFRQHYPDLGSLSDQTISDRARDFWKLSAFYGDAAYYLLEVESFDLSIAPYKYRVLAPLVVRGIHLVTGLPPFHAFLILNISFTLLTALIFTGFLRTHFGFSRNLSLTGGALFVTMVATTDTVAFPMLEPASLFMSLLIFIAVARRNVIWFIVAALCGVATKEVLAFSGVLWVANHANLRDRASLPFHLAIGAIPFGAFALIRTMMGGNPIEVNYGFNVMNGELPMHYVRRLFSMSGFIDITVRVFLSFSFLWIGLLNVRKNQLLKHSVVVVPVVILAAVALSAHVIRVLGVLFPIVIPGFLLFFHEPAELNPAPKIGSSLE